MAGHRLTVAGKRGARHGAHFGHAAQIDSCSSVMIKGAMIKKDEAHRIVNAAYQSTIMQKLLEKNIKLGQKLLEKNIKLWSRPELLEKNMCIITAS